MLPRFLLILFVVLNATPTDEVTIQWNEAKKLSWTDFRGPIEANSDAVAVTASGITFSFSVKQTNDQFIGFEAEAQAHFYPEKSWYVKEKGDDHILAHEQLHFDITELHVRKLRYEISKLNVSQNIKMQLRHLHEQANLNLAQMQNAYDTQSENSINKEQQALWLEYIKTELEKYRPYRS
jgi:hypothetical protein